MESLINLCQGFVTVATISNILWIVIGTWAGVIIGAIPGLTGAMAIALLIPVTFTMESIPSICMLLGIYCGAVYGGSITAILINTPGTPASAATAYDGFEMAKNGKAGKALKMALYASFVGGILSAILLTFVSPIIADFALLFGPAEYFFLILLGVVVVAGVSGDNLSKGLISGAIGILISTVGMDPVTGGGRFNFGSINLLNGLDSITVLIGLSAVSEILLQAEKIGRKEQRIELPQQQGSQALKLKEFFRYWKTLLKGSLIGTYIGAIPGIGSSVASFVAYNEAIRSSKHPETFGKGEIDAIAATESANNAVTGAAMIPLLTLGIPGDNVTAILLGAFMLQGLTPGPMLFANHGPTLYAIFAGLLIVNVVMLGTGALTIKFAPVITKAPGPVMFPVIFIMCCVGAYAVGINPFQIGVILVFGMMGYIFKKLQIPTAPFLIAFILGGSLESNLRRMLTLFQGRLWEVFESPVVLIFIALIILSLWYVIQNQRKRRARQTHVEVE